MKQASGCVIATKDGPQGYGGGVTHASRKFYKSWKEVVQVFWKITRNTKV